MINEEGMRELEEFFNRSNAERDEFERKAKEQGLTLAQVQELSQKRTATVVRKGRAFFAKLGIAFPFESKRNFLLCTKRNFSHCGDT